MKYYFTALLAVILSILQVNAQAQESQNHLLWRISGNGLTNSSYLFGTIHLRDRELFNFPDSLYSAISNCEAFSLEINGDSLNSEYSAYLSDVDYTVKKKEPQLKNVLSKQELQELDKHIDKSTGVSAGNLTAKQLYLMKDRLLKHEAHKTDMPTFMDAYLYEIAKDKGKIIKGLEHVADQIALMDDTTFDIKPENLVKNIDNKQTQTQTLIDLYLAQNLEGIQQFVSMLPPEEIDKMLTRRNRHMLQSMETIMQQHSLFTAVGTAHLPGNNGLISLLRNAGYTVTPVLCTTFTPGSEYVFNKALAPMVTVTDTVDGYSIKMPGEPSDVVTGGGVVKMKMFIDLSSSQSYITMHVNIDRQVNNYLRDSLEDILAENFMNRMNGADMHSKYLQLNDLEGKEYSFKEKDGKSCSVHEYVTEGDFYMIVATYKDKKTHDVADSVFKSFKLLTKQGSGWTSYSFGNEYIKVMMPKGKMSDKEEYSDDSTSKGIHKNIVDNATGEAIMVNIYFPEAGYNFVNDTAFASNSIKRFKNYADLSVAKWPEKINGYNAEKYTVTRGKAEISKGVIIFRGNYVYSLYASYGTNGTAMCDSFLRSFTLLPFPQIPFKQNVSPDGSFSVYTPTGLQVTKHDINTEKGIATTLYESYDSTRKISFEISKKMLSPYYWDDNDSEVLHQWMASRMQIGDTLKGFKYYKVKNRLVAEGYGTSAYTAQVQRMKVICEGRERYILNCVIPSFAKDERAIDSFFSAFTILKHDDSRLQKTPENFITDLNSSDSTTYYKAMDNSDEVYFNSHDLPILLQEYGRTYLSDTFDNGAREGTDNMLLNQVKYYNNDLKPGQIAALYKNIPAKRPYAAFPVLSLLLNNPDSIEAYKQLKTLLLTQPPTAGTGISFKSAAQAHPKMTATLYPDILSLTGDSINSNIVCSMARTLIDSGQLSKTFLQRSLPVIIKGSSTLRNSTVQSYRMDNITDLLSVFDDQTAWDEISNYQNVPSHRTKYEAAALLINHGSKLNPEALDTLAADKLFRVVIYRLLLEQHVEAAFPAAYLQQQYFAESLLYEKADNDDHPISSAKYIGSQIISHSGASGKYYVYEVQIDGGDNDSTYLAVSGPFKPDGTTLLPDDDNDATGVSDIVFDKDKIVAQIDEYLYNRNAPPPPAIGND